LPTRPTNISNQSLIAVAELCLYTIYGIRRISDLRQRTHWGHWCKCTLSSRLLQCYTSRNSYHCDKTAAISSENYGSFTIRNNFPEPLSLFYAASTGFWCGAESFPRAQYTVSTWTLCTGWNINLWGRPSLQVSTGYHFAKSTDINWKAKLCILWIVWNSLLCMAVACHWTGSNGS